MNALRTRSGLTILCEEPDDVACIPDGNTTDSVRGTSTDTDAGGITDTDVGCERYSTAATDGPIVSGGAGDDDNGADASDTMHVADTATATDAERDAAAAGSIIPRGAGGTGDGVDDDTS
jgi:hypothetical protein